MDKPLLSYNTIQKESSGQIVEKRSRFICNLYPVANEEEAMEHVAALKKEHYQARHVCFAYILGNAGEIFKYSDDGEPSGTAGRPMYDILKGRGLTYTLACVTRYFGGVLLGTGGLVRAYGDSLEEGLKNAEVITMALRKSIAFEVDYALEGKIKYALPMYEGTIVREDYSNVVKMQVAFSPEKEEAIRNYLKDITGGSLQTEEMGMSYVKA